MINEIVSAFAAPFVEQVGVQGFAYGLLGVRVLKGTLSEVRGMFGGDNGSE